MFVNNYFFSFESMSVREYSSLTHTFHQFHSAKNCPKGYTKDSKITVFPTGITNKPILPNRKPFRQMQIKNLKIFLMKVSGNSHSAENPLEAFLLTKRFVPSGN